MSKTCNCHGSGDKHSRTVVAGLERPRYSPGLILEESDLTAAVNYTQTLNRMLFRNLFGCGVVCGLNVEVEDDCGLEVTVNPGLAIDGCGDPVELREPVTIRLGKEDGVLPARRGENPARRDFWVVLCGSEKYCAPRTLVCDSDDFDGKSQMTRIRSLSEVTLALERPQCICECIPPKPNDRTPEEDRSYYSVRAGRLVTNAATIKCADPPKPWLCAPDCGCGTACGCGCCLLLAWVHWYEEAKAWGVLHKHVRRFVRPALAPDPIVEIVPTKSESATQPREEEKPGTDAGGDQVNIAPIDNKIPFPQIVEGTSDDDPKPEDKVPGTDAATPSPPDPVPAPTPPDPADGLEEARRELEAQLEQIDKLIADAFGPLKDTLEKTRRELQARLDALKETAGNPPAPPPGAPAPPRRNPRSRSTKAGEPPSA